MHIVILADPIDNQSAGVHVYTKNLIEQLLKIDDKNQYSFIHERENDFFKGKSTIFWHAKSILELGLSANSTTFLNC